MWIVFWFGIFLVCSWMFLYDLWRITKIFNFDVKLCILLWVSLLLAMLSFFTIWYQWENKILTILWTFASRIFVLSFLLLWLFLLEHIISIWYKLNKRIVIAVILLILCIWFFFALHTKITHLDIQSDKIEKDLKILMVSDIHVDYVMSKIHLNKIKDYIQNEKPDLVLIVWDLLNRPHSWYLKYYEMFNDEIKVPIYAVMWNHDVMWNTSIIQDVSNISSIKLLNNWVTETNWIRLVSIVDKSIWRQYSVDDIMAQTNFDNDDSKFTIFMTHQPINLEKLKNYNIDLELAWHTHRGQILWFRQLVYFMNDYWYWRYDQDWKIAFVSQWLWVWWLPFRFWTQSEMVEINLKKK